MTVLIAQGKKFDDRWRRTIPPDSQVRIGRSTSNYRVAWDDRVSREHIQVQRVHNLLKVEKLPSASNPVFYRGKAVREFLLQPGEHFVIGSTTFTLSADSAAVSLLTPNPINQLTFTHEFLQKLQFRDAEQRIEVLNRLPDVISSASNEQDLLNRVTNTLLAGIPTASKVGFVQFDRRTETNALALSQTENPLRRRSDLAEIVIEPAEPSGAGASHLDAALSIMHWDQRTSDVGDFLPSGKLIRQAITTDQTVLHQWQAYDAAVSSLMPENITVDLQNDWAFVCPIHSSATPGWAIYVAGRQRMQRLTPMRGSDSGIDDVQGDIKFCQLVGSLLVNLLQVKLLERRQASLRSFFSPIVLDALADRDPDLVLAPQKCNVSVMFCDLRGFSQTSEALGNELFQLLQRVSSSLDIMTGEILKFGGVIGDFHGDAAMGFWGWPLHQGDTAARAISAALAIEAGFRQMTSQSLGFQIAIGIATGSCVAGKIGSQDQVKVTAFGPVVNLASRLEGMNRILNSSILIDRATLRNFLGNRDPETFDWQPLDWRCRGLGLFQPYGMQSVVEVFQVLAGDQRPSDDHLQFFSRAIGLFQAGDWQACREALQPLADDDSGRRFLENFMDKNRPEHWSGIVQLESK